MNNQTHFRETCINSCPNPLYIYTITYITQDRNIVLFLTTNYRLYIYNNYTATKYLTF